MNENSTKSLVGFSNTYRSSFNSLIDVCTKFENNTDLAPSELIEVRNAAEERLHAVEKMIEEIQKVQAFMPPEIYNSILESLTSEKELLGEMIAYSDNYLEKQDTTQLQMFMESMSLERQSKDNVTTKVDELDKFIMISITKQAVAKEIKSTDIEEIAALYDANNPTHQQLINLAAIIKAKEKKDIEVKNNEETKTEEQEEKVEGAEVEATPEVKGEEKKEAPQFSEAQLRSRELKEKIDKVEYTEKGNIQKEVQGLSIESRLSAIESELEKLNSGEKLGLRAMVQVQTLEREKLQLMAYQEALENPKIDLAQSYRDNKVARVLEQMQENQENMEQSKANSEMYKSKLARFMSQRYRDGLAQELERLKQKNGLLQNKQKASAMAKYDKRAKKIVRSAKFHGLVEGVQQFAQMKHQEISTEISNIREDARFRHASREEVQALQESPVVVIDNIISLEERRRQLELEGQLVA